jgi:uncharacterized protein YggU (UPF0235/DUF167 family)
MPDDLPERLEIRVIPRAKRNEIGGERAGRLLVRTTAAPVDGKADKSVIRQVAEHLGIRPGCIEIATGHSSRNKTLRPNWSAVRVSSPIGLGLEEVLIDDR